MTARLDELKSNLEAFLQKHLTEEPDPRQEIRLVLLDDFTIVGEVVSSAFDGKTPSEQQEYLAQLLKDFARSTGRRKGFAPAILCYSPEEYRKLGVNEVGYGEKRGTLRTIDINTAAANDLYVTLDARDWLNLTRRIDLAESEDGRYEVICLIRQTENRHLMSYLEHLIKTNPYQWFDCDGYYFTDIHDLRIEKTAKEDRLISFTASSVPPWEV